MRAALCLILICGFAAAAVLDPRECHDNGENLVCLFQTVTAYYFDITSICAQDEPYDTTYMST